MRLLKIESAIDEDFGPVWDIYRSSFPPDGQRSLEEQFALFERKEYSLYALKKDAIMGLMGVWSLYGFDFIEHFAVDEKYRSLGCGAQAMMLRNGAYPTVLEVLPQSRAVKFFERCGFRVCEFDYLQPAGMRKRPVKLQLMSSPMELDEKRFGEVRSSVHREVYGLSRPLVGYEK